MRIDKAVPWMDVFAEMIAAPKELNEFFCKLLNSNRRVRYVRIPRLKFTNVCVRFRVQIIQRSQCVNRVALRDAVPLIAWRLLSVKARAGDEAVFRLSTQ